MSAIVEITTVARQANIVDDILNVFNYFSNGATSPGASDLTALLADFHTNIMPAIEACQSDQIVYLEVRIREVGGVLFDSLVLGSEDGALAGDAMAPYIAYEFIYRRSTAITRNGFKRFAGVREADVDQGGNVDSAQVTRLNTCASTLFSDLTDASSFSYSPIILGEEPGGGPPFRIGGVASIGFQRVTTQNSRKPWR